jgi:uncharacterized protein YacL
VIIYVIALLIGISVGIEALPGVWSLTGQSHNVLNQSWLNGLIGAVIFIILTTLFISPLLKALSKLDVAVSKLNLSKLVYNLLGAIVGLIIGVLISIPFMLLHIPILSNVLPFVLIVIFMYLGYVLFDRRGRDVFSAVRRGGISGNSATNAIPKLLDTSVIIDGRISEIIQTGFLDDGIIIPNFVILELQTLADSDDAMKRAKGRRGLDLINHLKQQKGISISKKDYSDIHEVDTKLLRYASEIGAKLVTNDFNLNKVAAIQGVKVLNINDLANAVKSQLVVGETLQLEIIRRGTERRQGIGYLPDGTMIVVEETADKIGETVEVEVVKSLQTSAGRMVFAELINHG